MRKSRWGVMALVALLVMAGALLASGASEKEEEPSLLVYCGAGLKAPMEELADSFTQDTGIEVRLTYGGSGKMLAQAEVSGRGDLLVVGAKPYYDVAVEKGLIDEGEDIAWHVPMIAVTAGNPLGIEALSDLDQKDVKLVLGDKEATATGKAAERILEKAGLSHLSDAAVGRTATVNELVVQLEIGAANASITMQDQLVGRDDLLGVPIPDEDNHKMVIPAGTLVASAHPRQARAFLDWIAGESARAVWDAHGFPPVRKE